MNQHYSPLVSIIVITYNSSQYILETLKSIKAQTYPNIELIITDDGSEDNTVGICREWLSENKEDFVSTDLVTTDTNTGISANCNRGWRAARGEWIKYIAGDDILFNTCIETNITLAGFNDFHSIFFTQVELTDRHDGLKKKFERGLEIFNGEENQLDILLTDNYLPAASSFIRRTTLMELGGFDERFPMLEDYPLWIKAVKNNHHIIYKDIKTVYYRIYDQSTSQGGKHITDKFYHNIRFAKSWYKFLFLVLIREKLRKKLFLSAYNDLIEVLQFKIVLIFKNHKNLISVFFRSCLSIIKPSFYEFFIQKLTLKSYAILKQKEKIV